MPCPRGRIALRTRSGICDKTVRGIHQEMDKDLHSRTIAALGEDVVRAIQSSSVSPAAALARPHRRLRSAARSRRLPRPGRRL